MPLFFIRVPAAIIVINASSALEASVRAVEKVRQHTGVVPKVEEIIEQTSPVTLIDFYNWEVEPL